MEIGAFGWYPNTDLIFGKNKINQLGTKLKEHGAKKILFVYGCGSIKKFGIYDKVVEILKKHSFEWVELPGVEPNPRVKLAREGIKLIREKKLDFILCVGGGSTIDCSKAIARGVCSDVDVWEHYKDYARCVKDQDFKNVMKVGWDCVPIGCVLTLAATGSEMNGNTVLTNEAENTKLFTSHHKLKPKFSILDPIYTYSVSKYQTKAGGFDIMSHLFESYFSENYPYLMDQVTIAMLKTMVKYLPIAIEKPDDYEARSNILLCSTWALNGLNNNAARKNSSWLCHRMQYQTSIEIAYDFAHGIGLSILTIGWMRKVLIEKNAKMFPKFINLGRDLFGLELNDNSLENAIKFVDHFEGWLKKNEIPTRFTEVVESFTLDDADKCAELFKKLWYNDERRMGWENLSMDEIRDIYRSRV